MPLGRETKHKGNSLPGGGRKEGRCVGGHESSFQSSGDFYEIHSKRAPFDVTQIEINDWMRDLTNSKLLLACRTEDGCGDAGVEGHDGGAGRQGRREGGAGKSFTRYMRFV